MPEVKERLATLEAQIIDIEEDVSAIKSKRMSEQDIRRQESESMHQILSSMSVEIAEINAKHKQQMGFIGGITFTISAIVGFIGLMAGPLGEVLLGK